jgi:hypothetical protein
MLSGVLLTNFVSGIQLRADMPAAKNNDEKKTGCKQAHHGQNRNGKI